MSALPAAFDSAPLPRMLWKQTQAQVVNSARIPAFSLTTILLPIMFFAFFGLSHTHETLAGSHVSIGAYLMGSFGAYAVSSAMVFNFGIGVAVARAQKLDLLQRATPLPASVAIAATVINALLFALVSLLALFAFAILAGGVHLPLATWVDLTFRLLLGALPLIGMGMAIGYAAGPNSAPAVTNLIYLPMSFASGLFVPITELPQVVRDIAPYLPTYHYGQIAWNAIGAPTESMEEAVVALALWTVILFGLAIRFFRLDQTRKFA
ncbi:MAG: ABC transporter permease [Candidatus Dormibacteraceae bacterium]